MRPDLKQAKPECDKNPRSEIFRMSFKFSADELFDFASGMLADWAIQVDRECATLPYRRFRWHFWDHCKRMGWRGDDRAGFDQSDDIACLNEAPGRFAWDDNEFAAFLQDVSGPQERALTRTSGNSTERGHRAGHNYHRVETGRTADEWNVHIVVGMLDGLLKEGER